MLHPILKDFAVVNQGARELVDRFGYQLDDECGFLEPRTTLDDERRFLPLDVFSLREQGEVMMAQFETQGLWIHLFVG